MGVKSEPRMRGEWLDKSNHVFALWGRFPTFNLRNGIKAVKELGDKGWCVRSHSFLSHDPTGSRGRSTGNDDFTFHSFYSFPTTDSCPTFMASPFLATIDETPDSAYPRLVEGRESRRSVQAAVGDEINSLVSGGGREIENENSPKEDTVPNRLWHRGQPSTRDRSGSGSWVRASSSELPSSVCPGVEVP